jgi:polyhydroxyalkanoate synthesis regulator phasin
MAKPKAAPIRDAVHLDESTQRIVKALLKNPDVPAGELKLDQGTAVVDVLIEQVEHHKAYRGNKSNNAKEGIKKKVTIVEKRHEQIEDKAKALLAEGKKEHDLVGILSGADFTDFKGKSYHYRETTVRKILLKAGIIHPKKKNLA